MEPLDRRFVELCLRNEVVYTRYADDITLSAVTVEALIACEVDIRRIIRATRRPNLTFNDTKRGIFTKAGRRLVTGLVITPDGELSLGRDRKREISAALHHIVIGRNTSTDHIANTKGWLAYAKSVEPRFVRSMVRKYGAVVQRVMRTPTPRRTPNR